MKVAKAMETQGTDIRVWCEHCCIRIAPHEERSASRGKTYHIHCYSKLFPAGAARKSASPAVAKRARGGAA
jgi:hypothetical protein